jgi:hypothetical protein
LEEEGEVDFVYFSMSKENNAGTTTEIAKPATK